MTDQAKCSMCHGVGWWYATDWTQIPCNCEASVWAQFKKLCPDKPKIVIESCPSSGCTHDTTSTK